MAEGARGVSPPINSEAVALPQCQIYKTILPSLACTLSTIFFHPSTWASVQIPPAPGKALERGEIGAHSVKISPNPALYS